VAVYKARLLIYAGAKSLDLSFEVDKFKGRCMQWDKYDQDLMALNVVHTKKCVDLSGFYLP
jgi:poly(A) polymerase Pap1